MEAYRTEEEQLEVMKRWLRDNGRSLLIGIAVVVLAVAGWFSWQQRQHQLYEGASVQYQNLVDAVRRVEQESSKEMLATAHHLADTLKNDYSSTTYAQFAALFKASLAVRENDLAQAETELRWVLARKPEPELLALTTFRLARVLHAKGDDTAALALLDESKAGSYAFAYAQFRGDISLAAGDAAAARSAYQRALELEGKLQNPLRDPLLEIKLRDLQLEGAAETAPAAAAPSSEQGGA